MHELWTGAISETYYLSNTDILEEQEQFVNDDKLSDVSLHQHYGQGILLFISSLAEGTTRHATNICQN